MLVAHLAKAHGIPAKFLHGGVSRTGRQEMVSTFQSGESAPLQVVSLKAGGTGLNLTAASRVIHYDRWWNPAVEDQASDRAHRIGQKRPVTVYRLIVKDSIEEKILSLHHKKRDLANQLLSGSEISAKLTSAELLSLIKA